jgi:hypothetical protein
MKIATLNRSGFEDVPASDNSAPIKAKVVAALLTG